MLPFSSLSREPDDEFFADGVTEEILNALAQIPRLRVAGRSSAFSFKGKNEDLRTVGAKLNVSTILEGTIRRAGNRLRITAQLSKASDGYQLWSERYDRVAEDVFAVQDEIASAIAGKLRLTLDADNGSRPRAPTQHLAAYELYLKGRALLYQRGRSIPKARECFEQAVALDPDYAQAWAGMADAYTTSGYSGFAPGAAVMPQAFAAARRALELDPDLAEAHNALACAALVWERDYALAEQEWKRAIELNPNYVQAQCWYGLFFLLWVAGRAEEAYRVLHAAHRIDPLSGYAQVMLTYAETVTGRHADAIAHASARHSSSIRTRTSRTGRCWSRSRTRGSTRKRQPPPRPRWRCRDVTRGHCADWRYIYGASGKDGRRRQRILAEAEERSQREYMQPCMLAIAAIAAGETGKEPGVRRARGVREGSAVRAAGAAVARVRANAERPALQRDRGSTATTWVSQRMMRSVLALVAVAALACATHAPPSLTDSQRPPARYLFAWAGDEDRQDSDFLAVIDLARDGDRYGTIVATTPIGEKGIWPHHTEHELSPSKMVFANGFAGNRTVLFDLHDALHPKVVERFNDVAGLTFLHSFARLPNGHVLATFQSHGPRQ